MIIKADRVVELLELDESNPQRLCITPEPNLDELRQSGSASVDLRLGSWFVSLRRGRVPCLDVGANQTESRLTKTHYVPLGGRYYLHPRCFVLGVTLEWVRLPSDHAGYVIGRSSWGRRGLNIATAIGVHPGFTGCLTLELSNVGEIPIGLQPGMEVSQLFIHKADGDDQRLDRSRFVGMRRPHLGAIGVDDLTKRMSRPNSLCEPADEDGSER
jgi:dCTP deaminase